MRGTFGVNLVRGEFSSYAQIVAKTFQCPVFTLFRRCSMKPQFIIFSKWSLDFVLLHIANHFFLLGEDITRV